jgi:hypothetical protein
MCAPAPKEWLRIYPAGDGDVGTAGLLVSRMAQLPLNEL